MSTKGERTAYISIAVVVTAIGWVVHKMLGKVVPGLFAGRGVSFDTPLKEFRGTHSVDQVFKGAAQESISLRYERMCVQDPLTYKDDPTVLQVVEQYGKLLRGEIVDRDGQHAPSDMINGITNPDYQTYLEAQLKVQGPVQWLSDELKRVAGVLDVEVLRLEYASVLSEFGVPEAFIGVLLTDERLNTYTAEDWRAVATSVKSYAKEYEEETIQAFLTGFEEKKVVISADALEIFAALHKYEVPEPVVQEMVRGRITVDQAMKVLELAQRGLEWEEAFEVAVRGDVKQAAADDLRDKYRAALGL